MYEERRVRREVVEEPVVVRETPVYREQPVVVQRNSGLTSYAVVKYAFILAITIVVLYFLAKFVLPLLG